MGGYSRAVKIVPVFGISRDTGIKPEILIGVSVNTFTVRGICARMFTGTNSGCSLLYGFRTHPLETDRAVFAAGFSYEPKRRSALKPTRKSPPRGGCFPVIKTAQIPSKTVSTQSFITAGLYSK